MPDTIPNLWPTEFNVDVRTPLTILKVQANGLSKVTKGILEGAVETERSEHQEQHRLVVVAPAYNGYRRTLITVLHDLDLPYPAEVRAEGLAESIERMSPLHDIYTVTVYPSADSDEQLIELVQKALQSGPTKALILSLIAKSNEARFSTA
jgi:hypothetical protein